MVRFYSIQHGGKEQKRCNVSGALELGGWSVPDYTRRSDGPVALMEIGHSMKIELFLPGVFLDQQKTVLESRIRSKQPRQGAHTNINIERHRSVPPTAVLPT